MRRTKREITVQPIYWLYSKTFWVNVIGALVMILTSDPLGNVLPKTWAPYIALVVFILNVIVRFFLTEAPVTLKR